MRRVDVALSTSLDVIRGGKYDPFEENYLIKTVSKLNAMFRLSTSPYSQVLTTEALRALLFEYRAQYHMICVFVDFPYCRFVGKHYKCRGFENQGIIRFVFGRSASADNII